jgi:NADH:ubiquinone oxidoreductase subunit 2 (subunit N)
LSYGVLLAAGLSSICVGTLGAFIQMSLWRLLGFASIAQTGLVLLGLSLYSLSSLTVVGFFFFNYLITFFLFVSGLTWLYIFIPASDLGRLPAQFYLKSDIVLNSLVKSIDIQRWCLVVFSISMASNAALPPFVGFFSKYLLILNILNQESVILLGLVLGFNIISSFYYLRVISLLWQYTGVNNFYSTLTSDYARRRSLVFLRPGFLRTMFPSWAPVRLDLWVTYNFFSTYTIVFLLSPFFINTLLFYFQELAAYILYSW